MLVMPEMEQYSMTLDELLPEVDVEKVIKLVAPLPALMPLTDVYRIVLLCAPLIKRMVLAEEDVLVFTKVRDADEPVRFTRPSMVTLSAPFKSSATPAREAS